jgi:lipoprotein-anchoring transpeptidase ErfK/SrfK
MQLNVGHFKTGVAIGLHGTDEPNLVGKAISGGCVRMHNGDVEQLFQIFRVGMKVIISAK